MTLEDRIRRLLRWYPRSWRAVNEDVVVATMMDAAEAAGRSAPSRAERRAVVIEGLGMRADARLALAVGALALLLAAVAGFASFWGATVAALPLTLVVVPILVGIGLVALLRQAGLVSAARALIVVALATAAFALSGLTATAWSLGFDAADEGVPATGLAAVWMPLFAVSWAVGALALGVAASGMLARTRMPRPLALVTAAIAGVGAAPFIGVATVSPVTSLIGAVGLCVVALFALRRAAGAERPRDALAPPARPAASPRAIPHRTRRTAVLLAALSATGSALGVVYALTGADWSPGASDSTIAMAQGITISLVSTIPLLAAVALVALARRTRGIVSTIGPLAMFALALAAVVVGYLRAPSWNGMAPAFAVSAVLAGTGIAWLLAPRLPGAPAVRVAIAALIGLGYAGFVGGLIVPALAFVVPIAAATFALTMRRRRGVVRSLPAGVPASPEPLSG